MGELRKLQAIVLRYADYGESNRMLTLFSPESGKLSAAVKGVRKSGAKLRAAGEIFTYGEYVLAQSKGRYTVVQFTPIDAFYDLRMDMDKLSAGVLLLNICEDAVQEDTPEPGLFLLLLRCLQQLCYGTAQPLAVVSVFLLHFARESGYMPALESCLFCGADKKLEYFDLQQGGVCCGNCAQDRDMVPVSAGGLLLMQKILALPPEEAFLWKLSAEQGREIYRLMSRYITVHLEKRLKIVEYIQKHQWL